MSAYFCSALRPRTLPTWAPDEDVFSECTQFLPILSYVSDVDPDVAAPVSEPSLKCDPLHNPSSICNPSPACTPVPPCSRASLVDPFLPPDPDQPPTVSEDFWLWLISHLCFLFETFHVLLESLLRFLHLPATYLWFSGHAIWFSVQFWYYTFVDFLTFAPQFCLDSFLDAVIPTSPDPIVDALQLAESSAAQDRQLSRRKRFRPRQPPFAFPASLLIFSCVMLNWSFLSGTLGVPRPPAPLSFPPRHSSLDLKGDAAVHRRMYQANQEFQTYVPETSLVRKVASILLLSGWIAVLCSDTSPFLCFFGLARRLLRCPHLVYQCQYPAALQGDSESHACLASISENV